jgi:hypothetical protein
LEENAMKIVRTFGLASKSVARKSGFALTGILFALSSCGDKSAFTEQSNSVHAGSLGKNRGRDSTDQNGRSASAATEKSAANPVGGDEGELTPESVLPESRGTSDSVAGESQIVAAVHRVASAVIAAVSVPSMDSVPSNIPDDRGIAIETHSESSAPILGIEGSYVAARPSSSADSSAQSPVSAVVHPDPPSNVIFPEAPSPQLTAPPPVEPIAAAPMPVEPIAVVDTPVAPIAAAPMPVEPIALLPEPVEPIAVAPAPIASIPEPQEPAPAPIASIPEPQEPAPAPIASIPEPQEPAPVVIMPAPAPVVTLPAPAPAPVVTLPAPAPAPVVTLPAPAPAPVVTLPAPAPAPVVTLPAPAPAPAPVVVVAPTPIPKPNPAIPYVPEGKALMKIEVVQLESNAWFKNCMTISLNGKDTVVGCNKDTAKIGSAVYLLADKPPFCNKLKIAIDTYHNQGNNCSQRAAKGLNCNGPYPLTPTLTRTPSLESGKPFFQILSEENIDKRSPLIRWKTDFHGLKYDMDIFTAGGENNWLRVFFEDLSLNDIDTAKKNPSKSSGVNFGDYIVDIKGEGVKFTIEGSGLSCQK